MNLLKKALNKCNGLYYPREYLCLAKESFPHPLFVYLIHDNKIIKDITQTHVFAGYRPLIFVLYISTEKNQSFPDNIEIVFCAEALQPNERIVQKDAVAKLSLKLFKKHREDNCHIYFYEGINGRHYFLSSFHQYIIHLNNQLFNNKPGNVFLPGNLYKQVQIAYSIPRNISLITAGNNELYNLFPSDLHGPVNSQFYIVSLRQGGKACKQVETSGKIVISTMHADAFQLVYSLGKNHMQDLKQKENFQFSGLCSSVYQLPLPIKILNCLELELKASFKQGIHKIFLFKIVSRQDLSHEKSTLAHIHNVFATWLYNKGLKGNYLL